MISRNPEVWKAVGESSGLLAKASFGFLVGFAIRSLDMEIGEFLRAHTLGTADA